jgi:hypothetical protein
MAKRRSKIEICASHRKERHKYHQRRTKIIKDQQSGKLDEKNFEKSESKLKGINKKIDSLNVKLFRCGKKYAKLKHERMKLIIRINKIKKILKGDRDMDRGVRNKYITEISKTNALIRDISAAMKLPITEQSNGKLMYSTDEFENISHEYTTIWEARKKIESLMNSGLYDFLTINGDSIPLETNFQTAIWALDDFIAEVTASQRNKEVKTPMVKITINNITGTITVE